MVTGRDENARARSLLAHAASGGPFPGGPPAVWRGYSSCSEKKPTGKNCVSTSGFAVVSASISPAIGPSALLSPISIVLSALLIAAPLSTAPAPGRPLTCGCNPRRWPWPCRPGAAGGPGCPHRLAPPPRHPSGWQPSKHAAQETRRSAERNDHAGRIQVHGRRSGCDNRAI